MLVSIVIPAYNAARFLPETVNSVIAQTFQDWELVILDDGSQDNTYSLACAFTANDARIRVVQQANAGMAAARNAGFRCCSAASPYILFLDSDDLLEPIALEELVAALKANPDVVAAHGLPRCIDQDGNPISEPDYEERSPRFVYQDNRIVLELPNERTTFRHLPVWTMILTPGLVLIRREHLEAVGEFDQSIFLCADWDMWLRLARRGDFARVAKVLLAYRLHPSNGSKNLILLRDHKIGCVRKAYRSTENTPEQRRMIRIGQRTLHVNDFRSKLPIAIECLRKGRIDMALLQYAYGIKHLIEAWRPL